jgi:hypothetical protein
LKPIDPEEPLPEWWMNAHPEHPDVIAQQQHPIDGEPQEPGTQVITTSTSNQTQLNYRITSRKKDGS